MDNQVIHVVQALCEDVGTPRALAILLLARAGEWAQLQQLRCEPLRYTDSEEYWQDVLVTDILRKCDLPSAVDKEEAAVRTFWECEAQNCRTNVRLNRFLPEHLFIEDQDRGVMEFITLWRKEIKSIIGHLPDHLTPRFSGGATYADTGKLTTIPDKMSSTPTSYATSAWLLPFWERTSWYQSHLVIGKVVQPDVVRGNIFFTVPKDGTKFRGCCKEASIPVALQLDVGRLLKIRLQRIGIDLRSDKEKHMKLAREGSLNGSLATIDMSNASDTLCRVLPKLVLPGQWWELLDSLRAPRTQVKGKWVRLEKFSSMGNGFTFELETLIFATMARVVVSQLGGDPDSVSCFGDDLILPTEYFSEVLSALRYFGFTPNLKKTFGTGPFRESCGGDYFNGVPVRAHYIEELPDEPQKWIALANGLRRVALAYPNGDLRWSTVRRAWFRALDCLPSDIRRLRGPESLGDIVIHDVEETWNWAPPPAVKRGDRHRVGQRCPQEGQRWIYAWAPVAEVLPWYHWRPHVQLASCTLGLPSAGVTPRGGISGYRRTSVPLYGSTWIPRNFYGTIEATP